jgi:tRNA-Thr(GGU) m(6)t(6)A37 methyltransferase TsaA
LKQFTRIGIVKNRFNEPEEPAVIKAEESTIEVSREFSEGLYRIEDSKYLDILFLFDRSTGFSLKGPVHSGEVKGVFASRSPYRPSPVGLSTVKLLSRSGNELVVSGLDALNGSPVIDIKPSDRILSDEELEVIRFNNMKANPRKKIEQYIRAGRLDRLLIMAAQLHGHYCPGLALGVMAGVRGMREINRDSDGLEELLAIVETNNCFSDGIQFVTSCSFGNNALIFKDTGKVACSLVDRSGAGIRLIMRQDAREYMHAVYPEFSSAFSKVVNDSDRSVENVIEFKARGLKKAFAVLDLEFDRLFTRQTLKDIAVPEYAPSHESLVCSNCNESIMASRSVEKEGKIVCLDCAGQTVNRLTGSGIITE